MRRKSLGLALALGVGMFAMNSKVEAWGAYHVGYTHVGYGGVQHYGATATTRSGPYSQVHSSTYHASSYHYGGASYHYGYARRW